MQKIAPTIQKRTMIFVSDHAFISKWWWIGAIRKTRLPVRLKRDHLDDHRQRLDQVDAADEDQQDLGLGHDRERRDRAAERHRAGVAHEHLGREGVEPEEADHASDQRRSEDRHVEVVVAAVARRWAERIHEIAAIARNVSSEIDARAGREPVEAVGEVDAVRRCPR